MLTMNLKKLGDTIDFYEIIYIYIKMIGYKFIMPVVW